MGGSYDEFLRSKEQLTDAAGFPPLWLPDFLYPFQRHLVDWTVRMGRSAIFADCLAGESVINSPDGDMMIEEAFLCQRPMRVFAIEDGRVVIVDASAPFINGVDRLYRFTLASGREIVATMGHRFLTASGWKRGGGLSIGDGLAASDASLLRSIVGSGPRSSREDDRHYSRTIPNSRDHCSPDYHPCDGLPRSPSGIDRGSSPSQVDVHGLDLAWSHEDDPGHRSGRIHHHRDGVHPSMIRCVLPVATSAGVEGYRLLSSDPSCSRESSHTWPPVPGDTILGRQARESRPSGGRRSEDVRYVPCDTPSIEFDTLVAIDYIRTDVFYDIEVPGPENFLANNIWSHNCGLGKGPIQLVWAENVARHTNRPVLILAPLAVAQQFRREAEKFGVEAHVSADGKPRPNITITNYERLNKFDMNDYSGVACDEASIIKHWTGATQKSLTRFLSKLQYRLLSTATPAPNDYLEMGVLSEALGGITHTEMLGIFFRQLSDDEKKKRATADDVLFSKRLSWRVIQGMGQWALRPHAFEPFWRWVASWARACRKPSDLGDFDDSAFILPRLNRRDHEVVPRTAPPGYLFTIPAIGINQERGERLRTLDERSELVAELVKDSDSAIVWCQLNPEGDRLEREIPGAVQVKGSQSLEEKERRIQAFLDGQARVLVTKPKIAGLGLNLQNCAHVVCFVNHSYEQFYQCIRRCYRFGQTRPVTLDVIATEGEVNVRRNMERKERLASQMFDKVIEYMNDSLGVRADRNAVPMEVPDWLSGL